MANIRCAQAHPFLVGQDLSKSHWRARAHPRNFSRYGTALDDRSFARLYRIELGGDPRPARCDRRLSPKPADVAIVPRVVSVAPFGNGTALVRERSHAGAKRCFNWIDHHSGRSIACHAAQMPFRAVSLPSEHSLRSRMTFEPSRTHQSVLRLVLPTAIILVTDWSRTK
jgi:hypothetical protein